VAINEHIFVHTINSASLTQQQDKVVMAIDVASFKALFPSVADHCEPGDLEALIGSMHEQNASRGEVVMREGDVTGNLFFVVDGELNATVNGNNNQIQMGTIKAGDTFCMANLLEPGPATMTVTANSDVSLLVLSEKAFRQLEQGHLKMTGNILRMLSNQIIELCRSADRLLFNRCTGIPDESEHHKHASLMEWASHIYKKLHG
jgi:CRP-like cAMP-binding protein